MEQAEKAAEQQLEEKTKRICTKPGVDYTNLKAEVWDTNKCFGCGACVGGCPTKAIHFGDKEVPGYYEPCVHCGVCYNVCPVSMGGDTKEAMELKLFGGPGGVVGSFKERYFARSTNFNIIKKSQDFGVVTTILKYILETGIVDCAIVVSSDEEYHPHAIVARRFTDLQKSMKIKYIWYPVLRDLRAAVADPTINNIAVVGVPCVIRAVRAIQESKLGKYRKKIKLTLGLFCWEIFKYELLPYLIFRHESINVRNLYKIDIKKDMTVETKDGSEFKFDLADTKPYVRNGCSYCGDFTGEWADISVGKAGSPPNYCTVLTRTPLGEEIFRQVCDKKLAETVEFEGGDIFKLKDLLKTFRVAERLSERKRQRWDKK